jgi:hypothetical protein
MGVFFIFNMCYDFLNIYFLVSNFNFHCLNFFYMFLHLFNHDNVHNNSPLCELFVFCLAKVL